MQLAIHRDNESAGNNKVIKGCLGGSLIGFFVVILIGFVVLYVVLLVVLGLLGQAIDGFFEGVGDFLDGLNPWNWGWNNGRGKP